MKPNNTRTVALEEETEFFHPNFTNSDTESSFTVDSCYEYHPSCRIVSNPLNPNGKKTYYAPLPRREYVGRYIRSDYPSRDDIYFVFRDVNGNEVRKQYTSDIGFRNVPCSEDRPVGGRKKRKSRKSRKSKKSRKSSRKLRK